MMNFTYLLIFHRGLCETYNMSAITIIYFSNVPNWTSLFSQDTWDPLADR